MEQKKHNFSPVEKKSFLEILSRYKNIIENRNTDGPTLRAKNAAWDQITVEYNASPITVSHASNKQLRRLWLNLNQRRRDALTKKRQNRLGMGDGPATSDAATDVTELAQQLLVEVPGPINSDSSPDFFTTSPVGNAISITNHDLTPPIPVETSCSPSLMVQPRAPAPSDYFAPATQATEVRPTTQSLSLQRHKISILHQDFAAREQRQNKVHKFELRRLKELHQYEMQLIQERVREAKAKADLAEHILCEALKGNSQ